MKLFIVNLIISLLLIGCFQPSNISYKPNKFHLLTSKIDSTTYSYYYSGKVNTKTFHGLIKKQPFIKVISYYESGTIMHEVLAFENKKIGVELFFYENGNLSIVRKYLINNKGNMNKRSNKSYFSDDFFINGISVIYKNSSCIIETNLLQKEFYENGMKKQEILNDKNTDYLKIIKYNINGNIVSIIPIKFDFIAKDELYNLILNKINCEVGKSMITDLLVNDNNKIPCWLFHGNSKYYSENGKLIKEEVWEKGKLIREKEFKVEEN